MARARLNSIWGWMVVLGLATPGLHAGTIAAQFVEARTDPGVVVDHQPTQIGGLAADTDFINMFGQESWQLVADDVRLPAPATIQRIVWWGFYDQDNPPAGETMRVRFYDARAADGLPGNVLYEQLIPNPLREATGRTVFVGVDPAEYRYQTDLSLPFAIPSNTVRWLEITQIDDATTHFRWEFSRADANGQAFENELTGDWSYAAPITSDTAYQLLTVPEPTCVACLGLFGARLLIRRRRGRR